MRYRLRFADEEGCGGEDEVSTRIKSFTECKKNTEPANRKKRLANGESPSLPESLSRYLSLRCLSYNHCHHQPIYRGWHHQRALSAWGSNSEWRLEVRGEGERRREEVCASVSRPLFFIGILFPFYFFPLA